MTTEATPIKPKTLSDVQKDHENSWEPPKKVEGTIQKRIQDLKKELDLRKNEDGNPIIQFETSNPFDPKLPNVEWTSLESAEENVEKYKKLIKAFIEPEIEVQNRDSLIVLKLTNKVTPEALYDLRTKRKKVAPAVFLICDTLIPKLKEAKISLNLSPLSTSLDPLILISTAFPHNDASRLAEEIGLYLYILGDPKISLESTSSTKESSIRIEINSNSLGFYGGFKILKNLTTETSTAKNPLAIQPTQQEEKKNENFGTTKPLPPAPKVPEKSSSIWPNFWKKNCKPGEEGYLKLDLKKRIKDAKQTLKDNKITVMLDTQKSKLDQGVLMTAGKPMDNENQAIAAANKIAEHFDSDTEALVQPTKCASKINIGKWRVNIIPFTDTVKDALQELISFPSETLAHAPVNTSSLSINT